MPVYEYLCRVCETRFEARRPMSEAGASMACPDGHLETTRLLSVFASVGSTSAPTAPAQAPKAGGGCGAGCGCMH